MRVLAYACAIVGMLLAASGIAEHYVLVQVLVVPHLAVILIGGGATFVLIGFLLFGALVRRERQTIEEAVRAFQKSKSAARHWVIE